MRWSTRAKEKSRVTELKKRRQNQLKQKEVGRWRSWPENGKEKGKKQRNKPIMERETNWQPEYGLLPGGDDVNAFIKYTWKKRLKRSDQTHCWMAKQVFYCFRVSNNFW